MFIQQCPPPAALADIPITDCEINFDQIVRLIFMRRQASPPFTETTIKTLAAWTPLLTAVDSTKAVPSPAFGTGLVIPVSEALTTGGNDNSTFGGVRLYSGEGSVTATASFYGLNSESVAAMDAMTPESVVANAGVSRLTVYMINQYGQMIHDNFSGIPIYNFRVSSVGTEGFNSRNTNAVSFDLRPLWDRNIGMVTPDFDALTEL